MEQSLEIQEIESLEKRLAEIEALTIPERGKEAKSVISESYRLARRSVIEAYYAGCLLRSVKADLEHGNFRQWLENNGIRARTAQHYMKLATFEIRKVCVFDSVDSALKSLPKPDPLAEEMKKALKHLHNVREYQREQIRHLWKKGEILDNFQEEHGESELKKLSIPKEAAIRALNIYNTMSFEAIDELTLEENEKILER